MANTETTINAVVNPRNNDTPIDIEKTIKALERNKFVAHYFETGAEAVAYLQSRIQNKRIAIGDSHTLLELKAYEALREVNEDVTDIQRPLEGESFRDTALRTMGRDVFLTSVNAISQTGEMVNIDGTGNRVAASLFGSQEVFFVLGINKITPDLASAIYRARNVAAPLNSKKNKKSSLNPCTKLEEKCYDCGSPDRICNALTIYYKKMRNMQTMEVIIINESLGF
ncbi:lactate utilization protein [uncultured Veillonella sp.]|uniref:lactate utilization protein n=1 Tax=uncultured Veillonella sp. TaxID=159268 RepID=UPI0025D94271|nr:lactate utilization protein [uncultured Veillonella sp.]